MTVKSIMITRLASSDDREERKRAFWLMHEHLLPQVMVAIRQLGSVEYGKLGVCFITQVQFWRLHRPDLIAAYELNGSRLMNEEAIEFVHAYVSRHFLNVQMARSDYLQTADVFYMNRMLH